MSESVELPTKAEIEQRMTAVDSRGVTAELHCARCDDLTATRVLPEEQDESRKSICRSCIKAIRRE